jgi:hypothetical protein
LDSSLPPVLADIVWDFLCGGTIAAEFIFSFGREWDINMIVQESTELRHGFELDDSEMK